MTGKSAGRLPSPRLEYLVSETADRPTRACAAWRLPTARPTTSPSPRTRRPFARRWGVFDTYDASAIERIRGSTDNGLVPPRSRGLAGATGRGRCSPTRRRARACHVLRRRGSGRGCPLREAGCPRTHPDPHRGWAVGDLLNDVVRRVADRYGRSCPGHPG